MITKHTSRHFVAFLLAMLCLTSVRAQGFFSDTIRQDSILLDSIQLDNIRLDSILRAQMTDSLRQDSVVAQPRMKANGFRIQVYFGDNSRRGKGNARSAGRLFKAYFPDLPVYVSFVSPHWLCRAGDFQTIEEAQAVLHEIREMGAFPEAVIVKSKVYVKL